MARVREQQGCCARAHRDVLTASLGTLVQWPSSLVIRYCKQALGQKQVNSSIQAYYGFRSSTRSAFDLNKSRPWMLDCSVHGMDGLLAFLVVKRHGSPF
jgi:hypothetical protein